MLVAHLSEFCKDHCYDLDLKWTQSLEHYNRLGVRRWGHGGERCVLALDVIWKGASSSPAPQLLSASHSYDVSSFSSAVPLGHASLSQCQTRSATNLSKINFSFFKL